MNMPMFNDPKDAARAVLLHPDPKLTRRSGQFLGGTMFADDPLTERQLHWLQDLLRKHGLPPLDSSDGKGAANV